MPRPSGSVKIFRAAGIDVYLHWMWAIVAYIQVKYRLDTYSTPAWALLEYITLFGIVLLHEFGHALACRQVGGRADTILLWPLGGVAFVQPPPRPGAHLWSIVAGPLVNVALLAPTIALARWANQSTGDLAEFFTIIALINVALLVFNMLPIYPLDGGQILRSILWFFIGPVNSLIIASLLGLVSAAVGLVICLRLGLFWLALIAAFAVWQSWAGFTRARAIVRFQKLPRHFHATCPNCRAHPPVAALWQCSSCGQAVDPIANGGTCPNCGVKIELLPCVECGKASMIADWLPAHQIASIPPGDGSR